MDILYTLHKQYFVNATDARSSYVGEKRSFLEGREKGMTDRILRQEGDIQLLGTNGKRAKLEVQHNRVFRDKKAEAGTQPRQSQ
jgi:hypothetical protein